MISQVVRRGIRLPLTALIFHGQGQIGQVSPVGIASGTSQSQRSSQAVVSLHNIARFVPWAGIESSIALTRDDARRDGRRNRKRRGCDAFENSHPGDRRRSLQTNKGTETVVHA